MTRAVILLIGLMLASPVCRAQTVEEIDKLDAALYDAWLKTPLAVRKAVFVTKHPDGFGMYTPRDNNVYKPGEPLVAYVEPVGYGWKEQSGSYEFGFNVDFLIKSADGKILGGQQNFARLIKQSRVRNREFMLTLTMDVSGADPGDYVLEYVLHDVASGKTATIDLPFKIGK
jgi:hypothetical protein